MTLAPPDRHAPPPTLAARQRFLPDNVLAAARARIRFVFDLLARGVLKHVIVSVSGGKDSTVLCELALEEAARRGAPLGIYFLDEEVVYQSTVDQVMHLMTRRPEVTVRMWLQLPFHLTNATSLTEGQLVAWEPGRHEVWMRPKLEWSVKGRPWDPATETVRDRAKGLGFYDMIENYERTFEGAAFLVGLRGDESPHRWGAVTRNPIELGGRQIFWGTRKGANCALYPLYDWTFSDVWRAIAEHGWRYSKIYDLQFKKGYPVREARVSSLIHERSFKALCDLPEFEPRTYDRLLRRVQGIALAQEQARSDRLFRATRLPKNFTAWRAYRDHLLATHPDRTAAGIFAARFARHRDNEYVARQQVRQLVLNDYENNVPVRDREDPREALIDYYEAVL